MRLKIFEKENNQLKEKIMELYKIQPLVDLDNLSEIELKDQNEAVYISATIKSLRDEKKRIEAEIQLLSTEFYKNLSES